MNKTIMKSNLFFIESFDNIIIYFDYASSFSWTGTCIRKCSLEVKEIVCLNNW